MKNMTKGLIALTVATALWLPGASMAQEPPAKADMMSTMQAKHKEMADLLAKALEDAKALQAEKDATKMKSKLAEHTAMLERMRAMMAQHEEMMESMKKAAPAVPKAPEAAPVTPGEIDHSQHHPGGDSEIKDGKRD
jgi:superoxide dismutase